MPLIKQYKTNRFTYGVELEVGDVSRELVIPEKFGAWEYSETDVVNIHPPYQYQACDPLGKEPPVGGEINTKPTRSIDSQTELVSGLLKFLHQNGEVTTNCISHTHIHVHVPGLIEDISALRRLTDYVVANQTKALEVCHAFDDKLLAGSKVARTYLKWDCGRPMPQWMGVNLRSATNFQDFIRLQCCGKDAKSMGRPLRYAINTYCLKHTNTVEFRLFRASIDPVEIYSCLLFVQEFMDAALNCGPTVVELVASQQFNFPKFRYSLREANGWQKTKWPTSRGKKVRKYIHVE